MSRLPVQVMARLLGVPDQQLEVTSQQVQQFVQGIVPGASHTVMVLASEAAEALMVQGRALGLDAVQAANRIGLMQQSLDATAGLIGHTALMLAQHPQLAAAADSAPDAMRAFVAEVERHESPIQNTRRFAVASTMLAGQAIQPGQGVLLVLASGNRDAAFNPQADRFEPGRTGGRSMGFGSGVHACPGTPIAIEIVATYVRWIRAQGRFDLYFARQTGFRSLGNARIPVF
jgi:cytochrome P450